MSDEFCNAQIVQVNLRDYEEAFLIGIIEAQDEDGIILYNINYRGTANGYVYLNKDNIISIIHDSSYLEKINILFDLKENQISSLVLDQKLGIKKAFLKWISEKNKLIKLNLDGDEIIGYIRKVEDKILKIEKFDWLSGTTDGYTIVSLSYINDFYEI